MPGCHLSDLPAVRECKGDVLNQNGLAPDRRHKHPVKIVPPAQPPRARP
jgi:hypothetical protein